MSGEQVVETSVDEGIATIRLARGKVNALTTEVIEQLGEALDAAENEARAIVLTGRGAFFSFGFDVPRMVDWPRERFGPFIASFCALYRRLFLYPKPLVAALNGHAVAGGCMLALTADARVMATGKAKLSLNEITFGAGVFAGVVEMLRFHVNGHHAARLLYTGEMIDATRAHAVGLADRVGPPDEVVRAATEIAAGYAKNLDAFTSMKRMLRHDVGARMAALEPASIERWLDIWYTPSTQAQIRGIQIR